MALSGTGTDADPYIIASIADFGEIDDDLAGVYDVAQGVYDFAAATGAGGIYDNSGGGWSPIGLAIANGSPFTGAIRGNGSVIKNLFIDRAETQGTGFILNLQSSTAYESGTATSATNNTLTDTGLAMTTNEYAGATKYFLRITGGTGANQVRLITANTADTITVHRDWGTNPSTDSTFEVQRVGVSSLHFETPDITNTGFGRAGACSATSGARSNMWDVSVKGGSVTSDADRVGGVLGDSDVGALLNCISENVTIEGANYVGGIVGIGDSNCVMDKCIGNSTCTTVNSSTGVGGVVGQSFAAGKTQNCFYNTSRTATAGLGNGGGTGISDANMKLVATFTDTATSGLTHPYDFVDNPNDDVGNLDLWQMDAVTGYPALTSVYVEAVLTTTKTATADVTLGNWVDEGAGTTDLFDGLADDSDATYIESATTPAFGDEYVATLASPDSGKTIDTTQDVTLNVRYSRAEAGAGDLSVRWHLRSNAADIVTRTFTAVSDTIAEDNYTLSTQEKSDLRDAINAGQTLQIAFEADL